MTTETVEKKTLPPMVTRWASIAMEAGKQFNLDPAVILAIIAVESSGNPLAQAKTTSAAGLMQLTRAAFTDVGGNWEMRYDPRTNIMAGAAYLSRLIRHFGLKMGIAAYYQGAGNEAKEISGEYDPLGAEAEKYADRVFSYLPVGMG